MQATRLPSPTKRNVPPVENSAASASATITAATTTTTRTRPRRPSVKDIRDGPVTQQPRPTAAPPSSFKIPPKPADVKSRSSSLGRSPSAGAATSTPTAHRRTPSLDRTLSSSSSRHATSSAAREPSHARRASSQSRPSVTPAAVGTRRSSISSSAAAAPPPVQRPLAQGTANRTHTRASSVQESSMAKKTPVKPSFSTYQQQFTPAKKLPPSSSSLRVASTASSAASPKPPSTSTPRRASTAASDQATAKAPVQSLEHLRAQTNLLQLALLHRDFHANFTAWSTSAHDKLDARFASLQSNYASSLALARAVRQSRNILALHRWTSGNVASLARKLAVLAEILRQVCDLTADDNQHAPADGSQAQQPDEGPSNDSGAGDFTRLTRQFDAWMTFVQSVWAARDHQTPRPSGQDSPPWTPAAREMLQPGRGRRLSRDDGDNSNNADTAAISALAATPIPGLGDAFKAALRSAGAQLDRLSQRLSELREPAIPLVSSPAAAPPPDAEGGGSGDALIPTPRYLADLAWELVRGMREEVQVMREAEFEVDIGEKAWTEQRVRSIERDVQGGWGTPAAGSAGAWGSPLPASLAGAF